VNLNLPSNLAPAKSSKLDGNRLKTALNYAGLLWFLLGCANSFSQIITKAAPKVGDVPPPLQLSQMVQGPNLKEVTWDELKGKAVVLEFWNTACGPCIRAIPHLNDLAEQFHGKAVVFISVSDDNPDHLRQFLKKRPIKTWLALDAPFGPTKDAFGVTGIPTTFLIDPAGRIVAITHPAKLETRHLAEVLAGKASSLPPPKTNGDVDERPAAKPAADTDGPPTQVAVSIQGPFPQPQGAFDSRGWNREHTIFEAKKAFIRDSVAAFFGVNEKLVIQETPLPESLYDIYAAAPTNQLPEMQIRFAEMLKTNRSISIQFTNQELDVYAMTLVSTNVPGLRSNIKPGGGGQVAGGFQLRGSSMDSIASFFEIYSDKPVVDETKAAGLWDVDIKWKMSDAELRSGQPDFDQVIKSARDQVGLQIKAVKRTLRVVLVRAAK
jgi:uncharacterized protein (TIGR03435 family)